MPELLHCFGRDGQFHRHGLRRRDQPLAQYREPGAKRAGTQGRDALAFKNPDGGMVTVVYNSGGETQMTSGSKNLQFTVPGNGQLSGVSGFADTIWYWNFEGSRRGPCSLASG